MARNKYPEQTVERILDSATRLFLERGYEHTTIQDILKDLGDLSKGAIYHHFNSKEEILNKVTERLSGQINSDLYHINTRKDLNALEKLQKIMELSLEDEHQDKIVSMIPNLLENPSILAIHIAETMENAKRIVEPIIRQGVEEKSIETQYPEQMAQVLLLIANIWLNPLVFKTTKEELERRIKYFMEMTEQMGIPIMSEKIEQGINRYHTLKEEK